MRFSTFKLRWHSQSLEGSMRPWRCFSRREARWPQLPSELTYEHKRIGSGSSTPSDAHTGVADQGGKASS